MLPLYAGQSPAIQAMGEWVAYCKKLAPSEKPDYNFLRGLIQRAAPSNEE